MDFRKLSGRTEGSDKYQFGDVARGMFNAVATPKPSNTANAKATLSLFDEPADPETESSIFDECKQEMLPPSAVESSTAALANIEVEGTCAEEAESREVSGIDQECILLKSLLRVCTSSSELDLALGRAAALGSTPASKVITLRTAIDEAKGWRDMDLNSKLQEHADANPQLLYGIKPPARTSNSECCQICSQVLATGKSISCGSCEKTICSSCAPGSVLIPALSFHNKQQVCNSQDCSKGRRYFSRFHTGVWEGIPSRHTLGNTVGKRLSLSTEDLHWWSCCGNREQRSKLCCGCGLGEYHQGSMAGAPPDVCKPQNRNGIIPTACALAHRSPVWRAPADQYTCALLASWIYDRDKGTRPSPHDVPHGLSVVHMKTISAQGLVQWAILRHEQQPEKCFVVFRGSQDLFDFIVDLNPIQFPMPTADRLHVHGSMLQSLCDPLSNTLEILCAKLTEMEPAPRKIVICGHSLGGGYALIAAAHLLQLGYPVVSVQNFGAPQVIGGGQEAHPIWQQLNAVTTTLVHNKDLVPRSLGACSDPWFLELLPQIVEQELNRLGAPIQMVPWFRQLKEKGQSLTAYLKRREAYFVQYSATGRVVTVVSNLDGSDSLEPFYSDEQRHLVGGDDYSNSDLQPVFAWLGCSDRSHTTAGGDGVKTADALLALRHFADDQPLKLSSFLEDHSTDRYIACARHLRLWAVEVSTA
jgi:hypothetical protein